MTAEQIEKLKLMTCSHVEAAAQLKVNESTVRRARRKLGLTSVPEAGALDTPEKPYESDQEQANNRLWARKYAELSRKYNKALGENSVVQQLVNEISELAPRSYSSLPTVCTERTAAEGTPQSAVLLFSDTHVGQVIRPDQTLGFGEYNFQVFLARLKYMEESVVSILDNHTTTRIDELVVAMLGDMLHGALTHSAEAGQRNTLFSQFYMAGHAIAQSLRIMVTRADDSR